MPARFVVVDADTLFGGVTRAFLIQLHYDGLIRLRWSAAILREMSGALMRARRQSSEAHAVGHEQLLRRSLPDAEVPAQSLTEQLAVAAETVNSEKDAHVAACALAVRHVASAVETHTVHLLTKNLKDFRLPELQAHGVELCHPDAFLSELLNEEGAALPRAFLRFQSCLRSKEPVESLLVKLSADGCGRTAGRLRALIRSLVSTGLQ